MINRTNHFNYECLDKYTGEKYTLKSQLLLVNLGAIAPPVKQHWSNVLHYVLSEGPQ